MIDASQQSISRWHVGFLGANRSLWVDRFSPIGFLHCLAFAFHAESGVWLAYDVCRQRTFVYGISPDVFVDWLVARKEQDVMRVLAVATSNDGAALTGLSGLYCVSAVKHLVGSQSRALRPIALWRDLLAAGAVEVFGNEE